jgi:histidine ammonia-lyase
MNRIILSDRLSWLQIAAISKGAGLGLAPAARARIDGAHAIVRALIDRNIRAYGVNTGVGALANVIIPPDRQSTLSHNILMSHAAGVGAPLGIDETRAIMAASVNNFAHGFSGLRLQVVERIAALIDAGCTPEVPRQGSVGYLSHPAHIGLVLIGHGHAVLEGERLPAAEALARLGLAPLELEAKEGLCLVNGTPCVTGLACLVLDRAGRLMDWADTVSAMSFETQRCQIGAIAPSAMVLRASPGLMAVTRSLHRLLDGSAILAAAMGRQTQDALSLRSIPQVHGAVRDAWANAAAVVERELANVTDNPVVAGTVDEPEVHSEAHAVGAAIGLAMDQIATAFAQLGMISERRLDRMVNPLVSGLLAFLAEDGGVASGFMIAQYTAASLAAENRRLASPASLDGGITSGLQEDFLYHGTPGALKALEIVSNTRKIVAIELLAACQSYDLLTGGAAPAARTAAIHKAVRAQIPGYADDRPIGEDIAAAEAFIAGNAPDDFVGKV